MTAPQKYKPTRFMAKTSHYDEAKADFAVNFIQCLTHFHIASVHLPC